MTATATAPPADLAEVTPDGRMRLHLHPGQWRAWQSDRRFVAVIAGTQSGKTAFGPHWLFREVQRRGPGDYLVVTPTFPLLVKKALPELLKLFGRQLALGDYQAQQKVFTFSPRGQERTHGAASEVPTRVYFGHAADPESLESATVKAAWLDEAGQKKFRLGSLEAVERRLAIHRGRCLVTTTPYDLGWLKQRFYDPWVAAGRDHPDIEVVNFDSTENPAFPREEFLRAREVLPAWKFALFYRGIFTRPAGLIYDNFDPAAHVVPRFRLPEHWPRLVGLDFGPVNTAAVFYAKELDDRARPTGRYFAYREYHPGCKRSYHEHVKALLQGEPRVPYCVGGAAGEEEWREELRRAGLPVVAPLVREVEVGIDVVYGMHARGQIVAFDDLAKYLDQKQSYSREVDEAGEVTDEIEDKSSYHLMDAERYLCTRLQVGRKLNLFA